VRTKHIQRNCADPNGSAL